MKVFFQASILLFLITLQAITASAQTSPYYPEEVKEPQNLTQLNGIYYYTANHFKDCSYSYDVDCITYTLGWQLWRSDGTPQGTMKIKEYSFDTSVEEGFSLFPDAFIVVDSTLYFIGNRSYSSFDLSKIDNSLSEPLVIKTFYHLFEPNNEKHYYHFTALKGILLFSAGDDYGSQSIQYGTELWRTDGTEQGTVMVKDIYSGVEGSYPSGFSVENGLAYFTATDAGGVDEWQSDGTEKGTIKKRKFSSKQLITLEERIKKPIGLVSYPNPFEDRLTLSLYGQKGKIEINVTDRMGIVYYTTSRYISGEDEQLMLDLSGLDMKSGIYIVSLKSESGASKATRIIKR